MTEGAASNKWYYCYLPVGIANGATSLLIPLFAKQLGASLGQIGIIAAASSIASIPAFMLWGSLSDKLKRRKPFVILGFLGMALCLFLMGISQSVPDYYISNLLVGLLSTASAPVATALIVETAAKDEWAKRLAVFSQIGGIGWVAGLVLGAIWLPLALLGITMSGMMRALFMMGAALSILSALTAWKWIVEPVEKSHHRPLHPHEHLFLTVERMRYLPMRLMHVFNLRTYLHGPHKFGRELYTYFLSVLLLFSGFTAFYAFFPIYLVDVIGLSSSEIFVVYIASQVTSVISYVRVGNWVQSKGSKKMQMLGSGLRVVLFPLVFVISLLGLPVIGSLVAIILLHAAIGFCWAIINVSGSMIISTLSPQAVQGEAFGAYNAVQGFGSIAGPIAGGMICQFMGYSIGFLASSAFVILGMLVLVKIKTADRPKGEVSAPK